MSFAIDETNFEVAVMNTEKIDFIHGEMNIKYHWVSDMSSAYLHDMTRQSYNYVSGP